MRERGITSSRALARRLLAHTDISEDQVRRLVAGSALRPPAFDVLNGLCYELKCGIADLIPIDHRKFAPHAAAVDAGLRPAKASKIPKRGEAKRPKYKRLGNPDGVLPAPIEF
jgi:DNA-binding Xre family transcriptional regulator